MNELWELIKTTLWACGLLILVIVVCFVLGLVGAALMFMAEMRFL